MKKQDLQRVLFFFIVFIYEKVSLKYDIKF